MNSTASLIDMFPDAHEDSSSSHYENPGLKQASKWQKFVKTILKFKAEISGLGTGFEVVRDYELERGMESTRNQVIRDLINERIRQINMQGGLAPKISVEDVSSATDNNRSIDLDKTLLTSFSPVRVWKYLCEEYNLESATIQGNKEIGDALVDAFRLKTVHSHSPARVPKEVSGMISFQKTCYLDAYSINGKKEWCYSTRKNVVKMLHHLAQFCEWADEYETARDVSLHTRVFHNDREIVSREKFQLNKVTLITFHNKLEVRMEKDLAEKLRIFISKFCN